MRVAMVAACEFPALRGSQVLVRDLATDLMDLGHDVHVVTYSGREHFGSVPRLSPLSAEAPGARGRVAGRLTRNLRLGFDLYRLVRRQRIDVIHAHNYEAPFLAYVTRWLTGTPVVYHSHNALSDELATYVGGRWAKVIARRIGALVDRQVPRRADFAIALTSELEEFLLGCGVERSRLGVIPPGVATGPEEMGATAAAGDREFVVGYAGNLDPYQDLEVLFEGFLHFRGQVQNAILLLITHERDWRRRAGWLLEELVGRKLARVAVLPTFPDVQALLQRTDALICPRSSWSGYPIKLLNYMASGRPVVAAAGSAKGIEDGVSGLIFRNGDARHLAEQLRRLHADPDLRRRLGECARRAVRKNHDRKKIASEIAKIHARLGSRRSGRGSRSSPRGVRGLWRLMALLGRRMNVVSVTRTTK